MSSSQASSGHGDPASPNNEASGRHSPNGWLRWLERNYGGDDDDEENEEDEEDEEDDEYTGKHVPTIT
jgi:hypothetical protein